MPKYIRRNAEQWRSLIEEQRRSTLSVAQFCKQQDLGYASFCQWRKKLNTETIESTEKLPAFLSVEAPVLQTNDPRWVVELQISSDTVLRIGKM